MPANNKINHEKYLERLVLKDIKVIPTEIYINSSTKILHKCHCGNIWNVKPNNVMSGKSCGCTKRFSNRINHLQYLKNLKQKDILIIPVDTYNGIQNKIKHKCTCGKIWKVSPGEVYSGNKCACLKNLNKMELYKNRKTILYYIKIDNLWKVGITLFDKRYKTPERNILKKRFAGIKLNIDIINFAIYENGSDAWIKEQEILFKFQDYSYKKDDMKWFAGYTELFEQDIRNIK